MLLAMFPLLPCARWDEQVACKRDVLMLDVALEDQHRLLAERQDFEFREQGIVQGHRACCDRSRYVL